MFTLLLILLILDGLLLGVVVLLQSGKGGGLASMGGGAGTETLIGGRQAATILTKTSWVCGGIFMGLAFILSIMSSRAAAPRSVLEREFRQGAPVQQAPAPAPTLPGAQPEPQNAPGGETGQQQNPQPNQPQQ